MFLRLLSKVKQENNETADIPLWNVNHSIILL